MSEKQLTVAELLARSGRDKKDKDTETPRRRRRSLDEGGISVAELTGSIPAVKEKPVESKHSSVPIDGPEPAKPESAKPEAQKAAKPESAKPEGEKAAKPESAKPEAQKAAKPESATAGAQKAATPKSATPETQKAAKPESAKPEGEKAAKPESAKPEAQKAAKPESATAGTQKAATPAIKQPAAKKPGPKAAEKTPGTDQTVVFGKIDADEPSPQEQTGELEVIEDAEESGVEEQRDDESRDPAEVEENTSATGVVLLTIIGVVLGVVVFKGFEMLWENFSRPVVAVLAILVTVGIVGVVKALRTANDGLSMFLAGLVGFVMTFGPLAVVLL